MLLSHSARGNSFEFAASSVSAPLHHPQTSFDGGLFSGGGRTEGRRDTGLISPRHGVLGVLGGVGGVGASTSSTSGRVELLDSPAPIPPGGALRRQFSHEPSGRLGGTERLGLEKERKRKSDELSQVSSSPSGLNTVKVEAVPDSKKKLKMLDGGGVLGGAPKELSLASEGGEGGHSMHSTHAHSSRLHASIPSMHEAHHFIDLLSMKQQTTLTRLDSLEMTIASLLDVDGEEATTAEVADAMASLASLARGIGEALPAPEPE
ncbi:hypothetical protein B484DRAFT_131568 [Ochromonadaceae sp. CCMP2298]|nr:hypothetical protein B484DRAFT_131568 [Ochromonadaceae sp. CCMP2298]